MITQLIMTSIFVIFMGYFTNPMRIKMFLVAVLGLESGMIIEVLTNPELKMQGINTALSMPFWFWLIVAIYSLILFVIGVWLAELDKDISNIM